MAAKIMCQVPPGCIPKQSPLFKSKPTNYRSFRFIARLWADQAGTDRRFGAMFESLAKFIATPINDKSPHTGGHCRKVPELTMMLAEAAHSTCHGYLKDFEMSDADRYELTMRAGCMIGDYMVGG